MQKNKEAHHHIVGIGASAGGLDALKELFDNLPKDGISIVVVQHLDPKHQSLLPEILSRHSPLKIIQAKEGTKIEVNYVYTIPPNTSITFLDETLHLTPRQETAGLFLPIDIFFQSLAQTYRERAVGIILSGSGSDGALGLQEIKQSGGITFAQSEESAKFSSMPSSAIATGSVDFIFTPAEIARQLGKLVSTKHWVQGPDSDGALKKVEEEDAFKGVIQLIHKSTGVDFSNYKFGTLSRRILRRMTINRIESLKDYKSFLEKNPAEVKTISQEILIQVTKFFREPVTFELLKTKIFPKLFQDRPDGKPIRIWVPGCSSGEELYSILISLTEYMEDVRQHFPVQIFGTDLSELAVTKARSGSFIENTVAEVSPERLKRSFSKVGNYYEVSKSLRDCCIFAKHNILKDPPFANIDLVSCQNVLIYFDVELQKRVLSIFHYALKPSGILILGPAETTGAQPDLFTALDAGMRTYLKIPGKSRLYFDFVGAHHAAEKVMMATGQNPQGEMISKGLQVQKETDRLLLSEFAPPGVIINEKLEVVQFRGHSGPYFEHSPGFASLDLFQMLNGELISDVRSSIETARKTGEHIRKEGIRFHVQGEARRIAIELFPLKVLPSNERFFLLIFEDLDSEAFIAAQRRREIKRAVEEPLSESQQVNNLRAELASTKEYLQSVNQEKEASNEELRAANEEIMSSNEELQSTNEELHTTKEELQSTNEELMTVNDELQSRNRELGLLNNDLTNLFTSLDTVVVILSKELRLRRFTPKAEQLLRLIPTDIGRSVLDFKSNIEIKDLEKLLLEVLRSMVPIKFEAEDIHKKWYSVEVRPYRTTDDRIDGLVLVFNDIDQMKTSLEYAEAVEETNGFPLLVLDGDLRVKRANKKFYKFFQTSPNEVVDQFIYRLGNAQWDIPKLKILLEEILPKNSTFEKFEVTHVFPEIGKKTLRLNARRLFHHDASTETILLVFEPLN
jgi:two-component system CheB/CheR fusion protein